MQTTAIRPPPRLLARIVLWVVAAFYAYGAMVHVMNILSMTGFDWPTAPIKWQVLDIVYLALDLVVVVGLIQRSWVGIVVFFCAALSQIALYTLFREWVLDVPSDFQRTAEDLAYLDGLVAFHIVTCLAIGVSLATPKRS